ncbi:MAG: protein of unknown function [Nitrospira sp.]
MLTWLSVSVLVLGLTSFVLDLIGSHEVEAVSWAQPVVVDGEEVDPSEDFTSPFSSDHQVTDHLVLTGSRVGLHAPPSVTRRLVRDIVFFDLASRPPPVL